MTSSGDRGMECGVRTCRGEVFDFCVGAIVRQRPSGALFGREVEHGDFVPGTAEDAVGRRIVFVKLDSGLFLAVR